MFESSVYHALDCRQARLAPLADGVVVGSALIRELNEGRSPYERRTIARSFVGRLAAATLL